MRQGEPLVGRTLDGLRDEIGVGHVAPGVASARVLFGRAGLAGVGRLAAAAATDATDATERDAGAEMVDGRQAVVVGHEEAHAGRLLQTDAADVEAGGAGQAGQVDAGAHAAEDVDVRLFFDVLVVVGTRQRPRVGPGALLRLETRIQIEVQRRIHVDDVTARPRDRPADMPAGDLALLSSWLSFAFCCWSSSSSGVAGVAVSTTPTQQCASVRIHWQWAGLKFRLARAHRHWLTDEHTHTLTHAHTHSVGAHTHALERRRNIRK